MARTPSLERFAERALDRTEAAAAQLAPQRRPMGSDEDLDPLLAQIGDARYVLLGEASHGTHEFYDWRARLTRRLIREKGFALVAVEGDWPDCYRVHRYVQGHRDAGASAREVLHAFDRWPTWMWANREVAVFVEWLREHNDALPSERRVGFYGLDVYSLWDSMAAVIGYLDRNDPDAARRARRAYECFAPFGESEQEYARATVLVPLSCEEHVVGALTDLRRRVLEYSARDAAAYFDAEQNALTVKNAELYYRTMVRGGAASWNVRDSHMVETLTRVMARHPPGARAVVWEHNTHVGDARYTDMAAQGEVNVGQLVRQEHGDEGVAIVGFATHRGSVIAGAEWGATMQRMQVPPARAGSWEDTLHRLGGRDALVLLSSLPATPELLEPRGHRAIGVVYHPQYERYGNYVPTVLPKRYDALIYLDQSTALAPLHMPERHEPEVPETYPSGM